MAEMTRKEFLDLLNEFSDKTLDPRLQKIDDRLDRMGSQASELRENIVHQFHIISEDLITKVQQVAEGVINLNEKFDRRLDQLAQANENQHKDILAAIKFSYTDLDRRITSLEKEMETLKQRMDKFERRPAS